MASDQLTRRDVGKIGSGYPVAPCDTDMFTLLPRTFKLTFKLTLLLTLPLA